MKTWQLRTFLEEFLVSQGASTERQGENLLVVRPPRKLLAAVGSKELVLAFNLRGLQEDPKSELGTVGNPVFDRILELARESGRTGQRFEPVPQNGKAGNGRGTAAPEEHFQLRGRGIRLAPPVAVYTPIYYLVFRVEYSLEDLPDELEVVPLDGISLTPLGQTPELLEYWEGLEHEPVPGRIPVPAFPVPPRVVRAALRLLEKRLRKRLAKIRRESDEHLAHETESIGNYYRQLIEETRNAGRRWTLPAGGREDRIRLLQLDWKRRVEEAQQYWHPSLDVRLAAVAAAQRPRQSFRVRGGSRAAATVAAAGGAMAAGKGRGRSARAAAPKVSAHHSSAIYWDETDRRFVDPPCRGCGTPGQLDLTPTDGGFLCPRCARLERGKTGPGR